MKKRIAAIALTLSAISTGVLHGETPIAFDPIPKRPANHLSKKVNLNQQLRTQSLSAGPRAAGSTDEIRAYANLWYQADWDYSGAEYGVYSFPVTSGTYYSFPSVTKNSLLCGNAGAVYADGKYFVATSEEVNAPNGGYVVMSMKFYVFNTETWSCTEIANADEEFKAMDMAYDPTTDRIYGCFVKRGTNGYYYFGTLDIETGAVTMIQNYGQNSDYSFTGIAIADNGTVYAINSKGRLCTIDKSTGNTTTVGETGLIDQYMTSAAYEPQSGKIYYALNTDYQQGMYEINPATAAATKLYDFFDEESVAGMYFLDAPTSPDAPAQVSNLTANFTNGSLSGTVTFTAPTTTSSGSQLSGPLTYTVKINGESKATGTVQAGRSATVNLSVATPDNYSIAVSLSNASGESAPVRTGLFIGPDTPLPVTSLTLADNDGQFTLSWEASQSAHGGWLDPEALCYKIIRYPDNITVAAAHKGTTFSEARPVPTTRTRYHYTVEAVSGSFTGEPVKTNELIIGNYAAPCTIDFDHSDDADDFTLIDGDRDGKTWIWSDGQMHSSICLLRQVNDYLVLPPIYLESGNSYRVSFQAKATRGITRVYPERVALYAGTGTTLQDLTTEIIAPTDVETDQYITISGDYTPAATGPVHFAVRACSDMDNYYLWIDDFSVSAPVASQVPASVTGFTATPGENGALEATLHFTLPTTDMKGDPLGAISGVEIYRGEELLTTLSGTPGQQMSYTDRTAPNGLQTYTVIVKSTGGNSLGASAEVYVGVHNPNPVTGITATAGAHNGIVSIRWNAPATDTEGISLPAGSVRYTVTRYDQNVTVVATNITETSFTDEVTTATANQEFVQYAVTAINVAGSSEPEYSNTTTYGRLNPTPMNESFADGYATHEFVVERDNDNASWTVTNPPSNPGVTDQDNDGGLLRFTGVTTGDEAVFISGSYDISNLSEPALIFYYLYPRGITEGLSATIIWEENGELKTTTEAATPHAGIDSWQRMIMPMPHGASKVQFTLNGKNTGEYATSIFVDNISIVDLPTPNITLHKLSAPAVAEAGEPFTLTALIENSGASAADATVELLLNDEVIDTRTLPLATGEYAAVDFSYTSGTVNPAALCYQARVSTPGDRVASDNLSATVTVGVHYNNLPSPTDARAVTTEGGAAVTWTAPDLGPETPVEVTDDVESYVPFSIGQSGTEIAEDYIGQWSTYDGDGLYTLGVGHGSTAIPNASVPKAFMAFNGPAGNMTGSAWECHSGSTMFVSFAAIADTGERNDDWLISPKLTGSAQAISFFARSATDLYGLEQMEVLYSKSGTAPSDFILIEADNAVPVTWREYSYYLPEGALYFAIRCTSENIFALCVDDITFTPCGFRGMGVELTGYNLYRDGELLATLPATATGYTDATASAGSRPTYHVTALYASRESRPSNGATLDASALGELQAAAVRIYTANGYLMIQGAAGKPVAVATPDGRLIFSTVPTDDISLPLGPGTYIVRAADCAAKIAIR